MLCAANRLQIQAILQHLEEIGLPLQTTASAQATAVNAKVIGTIAAGTHQPQTGDAYPSAVAAAASAANSEAATLVQTTTIATLASQTSFTLTAGSADNDAYNGCIIVIKDAATATQRAVGWISDYVGSSRTVTLASDPAVFTMAVGDTVYILPGLGDLETKVRAYPMQVNFPTVIPLSASQGGRNGGTIYWDQFTAIRSVGGGAYTWTIIDASGAAISLAGKTVEIAVCNEQGVELGRYDSEVSVGGAGNNVVSLLGDTLYTQKARTLILRLWNVTDSTKIWEEKWVIRPCSAPSTS